MVDTPFNDSYIETDAILAAMIGANPSASAVALKALAAASQAWYCQEATRHIDQLRLRGDKYDSTQDRAFPRVIDGIIVGDSDQNVVVPDDVLRACMEEAIALYAYYASTSEQKRASLQAQGVKSYSIGDLSETYGPSTTTGPMQGLKSSDAYRLLSRYIARSVTVR